MKRVSRELATGCMFDKGIPPVVHVEPGEPALLETKDCFGGRLTSNNQLPTEENVPGLFSVPPESNYLTGPVYVQGASAGDVLAVRIERLTPVGGKE